MNNTYKLWRLVKSVFLEIYIFFKKIFSSLINKIWNKFLRLSLAEKIVYLNLIPAFFAIILPVAQFKIFGSFSNVNNPLGVHLIGIIIIIIATSYLNGIKRLIARTLINAYYLFWIIYIPLSSGLTKAVPNEICFGYYLNIAVPVIFIAASLAGYYVYRE
jgi:hypothetical protein